MRRLLFILSILILSFLIVFPVQGESASLYLAPSKGTFFVGSTFSVSIYVDTKGNEINAVEVDLRFPPDILQVTTPTAGESFISEWLTPPSYSNTGGKIIFKGGIPGGIKTSAGLVSTITFRAKSPGLARVEFLESSKVLLNDGKGTPIFATNFGGVYEILVPPAEGPKIFSPTHYDSDIWYSDSNPQFYWEKEEGVGDELRSSLPFASARVTDFSFSFSQNPQENPDNISEGDATLKFYDEVPDGIWYFHLRAKKNDVWGRTSHFPIKIDTTPPQKFELRVDLGSGFVYFDTKDLHSGLDHYEVSILNISETPMTSPFFIEATSPYKIPYKKSGKYSVIVRAYDKAGNSQTAEAKFRIISPALSYIEGKGIQVKGILFSWRLIYVILFLFLIAASYLIFYFSRRGYKKGNQRN